MKLEVNSKYSQLEEFVKSLPDIFDTKGKEIYSGRNVIKTFDVQGFKLNVKSFKIPHLINKFAYAYIRGSKAKHSFEYGLKLNSFGDITPDPIGYVETFKNCLLNRSFYISIHNEYDFTIRDLIGFKWEDKDEVLKQFAAYTYEFLHKNSVHHLDYSRGNILIKKTSENTYSFNIVDINRMRFEDMPYQKGLRNFAQIWANPDELEVVGREYARICGENQDEAAELLIKFDAEHKEKIEKKKRWKRIMRGK